MPAWDDPAVKWDDPLVGWAGGAVSVAPPVQWDDAVGTWSDGGQGWSGERTDLAIAAKPGLYVKNPAGVSTGIQASIVTQGIPGQPAQPAPFTCLKIVVPPGQEAAQIEYDLYPNVPTSWGVRWNRGSCSISAGDDGKVWDPGPATWWGANPSSVYKRSGNVIYRAVGSTVMAYAARARLPDGDWADANFQPGMVNAVVAASGAFLPPSAWLTHPNLFTGHGPRAKDPSSSAAKDAGPLVWRERTMGGNPVTLWRRATYPQIIANFNGPTQLTAFSVATQPIIGAGRVFGRVHWRTGGNFVISQFLVDTTQVNPFATAANNIVIVNQDTLWHGYYVNQIGGWGNYWPLTAGQTVVTCEAYSLMGAGSQSDPFFWSAQGYFSYAA